MLSTFERLSLSCLWQRDGPNPWQIFEPDTKNFPHRANPSIISINLNEIAIMGGRNELGEEESSVFIYDTTRETVNSGAGRFRKLLTSSDQIEGIFSANQSAKLENDHIVTLSSNYMVPKLIQCRMSSDKAQVELITQYEAEEF